MNELKLLDSKEFGAIQCDFYGDGSDLYMTRGQVGSALDYANPVNAIKDIHTRHKDRLDLFSGVAQIAPPSGGTAQSTTIYSRKGVMEICRWSQQPKADSFMDWAWDVMDGIMSGKTRLAALPRDYPSALRALADETEQRMALEVELDRNKEWYSIKRVAHLNCISFKALDWRKLKAASLARGYGVRKIFDANYGEVNTYHQSAWEDVYPLMEL